MIKKGSLFLTAFSFTMCITFLNQSAYASSLPPVKNISWMLENQKTNLDKPIIKQNIYLPERKYIDSYTVKAGDSIQQLLRHSQIDTSDIRTFINTPITHKDFKLTIGQNIQIERNQDNRLSRIILERDHLNTLQAIKDDDDHFYFAVKPKEIDTNKKYVSGKIISNLDEAAKVAGLTEAQLADLTNIFNWDIDFKYDIKEGDTFSIVYEEKTIEDRVISTGNIIAAEFNLSGQEHTAFAHTVNGVKKYYDKEGNSLQKAFLRNPIEAAKVSSIFNNQRLHPIFSKIKPHKGTDYAAKIGTPIKNTGEGVVSFVGKKKGYGNVVMIDHGMNYSTVYAHMSKFEKGLKEGDKVEQGHIIGFVGQTGYATGPHLHYEFRINGEAQNSLTVELPSSTPISEKQMVAFKVESYKLAMNMNNNKVKSFQSKEFSVAGNTKYFE